MKKFLTIIIAIALVLVAVWRWPQIESWFGTKAPELAQVVQNNPAVENLTQQVINGGALRSLENSPDAYLTQEGTINYTNQARQQNGNLPPLKENALLDKDAAAKLADMFARQYFEHISPDGKGPSDQAKAVGYNYVIIGENLALGNFKDDQDLVTAWMNSPGHRANILNTKYLDIGVAVGQGTFQGTKEWLAVQEFGKPASSCPAVDANLKSELDSLQVEAGSLLAELQAQKSQINSTPQPQSQAEVDAYNQQVANYNALVKEYNNKVDVIKQDTAQYNAEVNAFNACAS